MKTLRILALVLIVITSITPKKSEAAIGAATGNAPMVIAGIAAPFVVSGTILAFEVAEGGRYQGALAFLSLFVTVPLGIILLDGEEEQAIEYTLMDKDMANDMGVTNAEMNSFNMEIDQANILLEEVSIKTQELVEPTPEAVRAIWEEYQEFVSLETFSAMEKIGSQFAK
ncbi:MAG: hypothetical protein CME62_12345 [Halobacteriovoraceae bacterium]|nr:hypothetical protein [Halobacteriovoraceae bacterium]|tara:strand:+ start:8483 stop:8992 length:510 start_codon:yes stop_codon:yes gene_type:complete